MILLHLASDNHGQFVGTCSVAVFRLASCIRIESISFGCNCLIGSPIGDDIMQSAVISVCIN